MHSVILEYLRSMAWWRLGGLVVLGYVGLKTLEVQRRGKEAPSVGSGIFAWSTLANIFKLHTVILDGSRRYPDGVFRVPIYPFGVTTVLTNDKLIAELRNAPEEVLSMDLSFRIFLRFRYTLFRDDTAGSHFYDVIRTHLTNGLNHLFPNVIDEIQHALGLKVDAKLRDKEWVPIPALPLMSDVAVRVANRSIVGLPLCRNEEYLEMLNGFAVDVPRSAFMINMFPSMFHEIVGPLLSKAHSYRRRMSKFLDPIIDDRRKNLEQYGPEWAENPKDYLSGIMETAPEGFEQTNEAIAMRVLQINFGSILSTFTTLTHALYCLASEPAHVEILRKEIEPIIEEEGWTKMAMGRMHRFDSFLRESARMNPLGMITMHRTALVDYTFTSNPTAGPILVRKGETVASAMDAVHQNPREYENPAEFRPWRFYDEGKGEPSVAYTTTSADFLGFGFGQHACPGRFFVTPILKAVLSHILLNYDIRVDPNIDGAAPRPKNEHVAQYIIPNTKACVFFRLRERA